MEPVIGLDFGTTNSAIAVADSDRQATLASFADGLATTNTFRSILYFPAKQRGLQPQKSETKAGPEAINVGNQRLNTILDLGCGTGRFSESLAAHFDSEVVGLDPSTKMLDQAQKKLRDRRVRYELGRGEAIPLANNSVDLIFTSMTFHHFDDPMLVARECRRVLQDASVAILRTGTRERIPSYPYVEFFPKSRPIMEERLPTGAFVREVFEAAGFSTVSCDVVVQQIAADYESYIEKISAGADSVLAQLPACDFQNGLDAMRAHATRVGNNPVCEPIDVFVFR